ncbi:hypothetical protein [Chitinibacter sp. ZOR0017]|uniref:hypothetical protein n=1 Tax=Chitinibacter sp. ZOR0017 TaxID=1339254 RepID=UPI0006466E3D|nr:hypothetical protein [Chitinibacter sp. ZOR0017]
MMRYLGLVCAALLISQPACANPELSPACRSALLALQQRITQDSATLSQAELETSQEADQLRLNCVEGPSAYQEPIGQLARRLLPPPPAPGPGIGPATETALTLAMLITLILTTQGAVSIQSGGDSLFIGQPR